MSNWTDKIPQFNPYVQQLPIDEMVKVGMQKQQQYNEGVQRIQSNIDNVASMDIARDVDKKYLESKLNSLGNNLKAVAAGDFSNFQLTNSVAGMVGQIANDKIVQAGVYSTARLKSEAARIKQLEAKGLTDANNDAYYSQSVNAYTDNPELTDESGNPVTFNGSYTPWTDIIGKMKDALKDAGEDESITEQIFVTGSDGKPLKVNGHYQYADAKQIDKVTTNKPAVLAAINSVFTQGDVKQQLAIDGWATYKDVPVDVLLNPLTASYEEAKQRQDKIGLELTALSQATNISPEQRDSVKQSLVNYEKAKLENEKNYISLINDAKTNPETFKQNFYTRQFKENLQTQFVKELVSTTYGTNEALQQQNYRQDFAFKERVQSNAVAYQNATLDISRANLAIAQGKFEADYPVDPSTGIRYNATGTGSKSKTPKPVIDPNDKTFKGDIPGNKPNSIAIVGNLVTELSEEKKTKAFGLYADLVRQQKGDINIPSANIQAGINKAARAAGVTPEQFLDRWASTIFNKYDQLGLIAPPNLKQDFEAYNNVATNLNHKINLSTRLRKEAFDEAGVKTVSKELEERPGLNFTSGSKKIHLSPLEIVGIIDATDAMSVERARSSIKNVHGLGENREIPASIKGLNKNQLEYFNIMQNKSGSIKAKMELKSYIDAYKPYAEKYGNTIKKGMDIYSKKLEDIIPFNSTKSVPVDMSKPEIAKTATDIINAYINSSENISMANQDEKAELIKAMTDPSKLKISWKGDVPNKEGMPWTGALLVNTGGKIITVTDINQKNLETISGATLAGYKNTPIQDLLNVNKKTKSTNSVAFPGQPNAWETAYLKNSKYSDDIKKAGYSYRADVVGDVGNYRLVSYIKSKESPNWIPFYSNTAATSEQSIVDVFNSVTPAQINSMYKEYLLQK